MMGGKKSVNNRIRTMILVLLSVVFIGYMFLWIMSPTYIYSMKWRPQIREKLNTTYFGTQGDKLLMFTFPILFIAALGCVYRHLGKKCNEENINIISSTHQCAIWKRPMIIKGLGIVSLIELTFFIMFIALLVWSFSNYLQIGFAKITAKTAAKHGEKVWESKLDSAALRLGLVGNIVLSFLFFPVSRGSSLLPLFGLTSEGSIKYHIWLGHMVMALFTAHGVCYIIYWAATHQLDEMLKWAKTDVSNVAGEISLVAGLVMWATTFSNLRRKMFELFFYTHHLYIVFVVFFVFHVGISYAGMMLPGFYLFLIDRFLRFLQSRQGVRLVSARVLPCETVELIFSKTKGITYTPPSILFVNIPSISKLEWHPFTITSSSGLEPEKISVLIKGDGAWSRRLHNMLASSSSLDHLDASVEGPYGPLSTNFQRHDLLIMVSGGSGITPFISIIRDLMHMHETKKCKTPKLLLVSAFKNSSHLTMLDVILPISGATSKLSELVLQIEAYITRENQQSPTNNDKNNVSTIWFKPKSSDVPIAPVLGQNNWFWLGSIISLSFIIYLFSMGILTRYYIYPIDHNTNDIYPNASRASLNMVLICLVIMITCTSVFMWNKQRNAAENIQIQNMEGVTPMSSPNSWFYNAERELESLPNESLVQCTNVHYGQRPDLKKLLLQRKESSVGVLVCGPKKMRHEVAKISSSGSADNLHFESISFSW
ncbi:hypothetical protein Leryth_004124 [Lithospermum erythrorhizon]|uniref:ferric-chelate reductase (NADH) n=1 Tax=Lithospermum erythrorhizon TaxID=34254 RepID=A0AAV3PWL0_LITER|nr:hypothetical protein Leryth_004124 [Lithospermum erythrorhizon]